MMTKGFVTFPDKKMNPYILFCNNINMYFISEKAQLEDYRLKEEQHCIV